VLEKTIFPTPWSRIASNSVRLFADVGKSRKMHHRHGKVFGKDFVEAPAIKDVAALQRPPFHGPFMAGAKIVIGDRQIPARAGALQV
jgi:hypothetical protein